MSSEWYGNDLDDDLEKARYLSHLSNELPAGFEDWGRPVQADYIASHMTRLGLIERILARLDWEPGRDVSQGNQRLKIDELALIYLAVGGLSEEAPPGFEAYPRDEQVAHVTSQMTRGGLMERVLARLNWQPEYDVSDGNQRLRKLELAVIYIELGGVQPET